MTFVNNTLVRLFELIRFDFYVCCQLAGKAELRLSKMNMFYSLSFLIKSGYRALGPDFWDSFKIQGYFLDIFVTLSIFKAVLT